MALQAQADQDLVFLIAGGNPPARCDQDLSFIIAQRLVPATITTLADQELVFAIAQRVVSLVELVGGGYQDFLGTPLANGYLLMTTNNPAEVYTVGSMVVEGSAVKFRITFDANGNCVAGQRVFSTDVLTPACEYIVQAFSSDGTTAGVSQIVTAPKTNPSYDISQWIPTQPAF